MKRLGFCALLFGALVSVIAAQSRTGGADGTAAGGRAPMAVSRTITDYVLRERQGILVSDAARDQRFAAGQSILRSGIREAICVPMKGRHETLGVLYLDTFTRPSRSEGEL